MRPAQEFIVKMAIGVVALSVVTTAAYLVMMLVVWTLPGNYAAAALSYLAFFLVGFVYVVSWMRRQFIQWWGQ